MGRGSLCIQSDPGSSCTQLNVSPKHTINHKVNTHNCLSDTNGIIQVLTPLKTSGWPITMTVYVHVSLSIRTTIGAPGNSTVGGQVPVRLAPYIPESERRPQHARPAPVEASSLSDEEDVRSRRDLPCSDPSVLSAHESPSSTLSEVWALAAPPPGSGAELNRSH